MMEQPSGEPHLATGYPPGGGMPPPPPGGGGLPPPGAPPGGGGFGGPPGGGGFGGPPGGGGFGGPPGGGPPGGDGFGGPPGGGPPGGGGFGGPPGGGPPGGGGFGGPPGGGPPGGGGYGGPPGGGPPGGGGYGGPPGGGPPGGGPGGYGPPQGGGYGGPPGGNFGGPPMGMGGPPMGGPMPQSKKGPNLPLIIGLGCGGIVVIGIIVVVVGFWWAARKTAAAIASLPLPTGSVGDIGSGSDPFDLKPPAAGDLKAELKDLRNYKAEYGKTVHFVGELYNTGKDPIGVPNVKVTFFDASKTAIDSGTCYTIIRELAPGDKVPCTFSLFKTEKWDSYKIESNPMRPFFSGKGAKLKISDTKFVPKKGFNPHTVEGKITNESAFKAKGVWAIVSLYDKDGKICGADNALVAGNDLEPSSGGIFSAKIYNVAAPPDTYKVIAVGYAE